MRQRRIIQQELTTAAKRWRVDPKDILKERIKNPLDPLNLAKADTMAALQNYLPDETIAKLFKYRCRHSINKFINRVHYRWNSGLAS